MTLANPETRHAAVCKVRDMRRAPRSKTIVIRERGPALERRRSHAFSVEARDAYYGTRYAEMNCTVRDKSNILGNAILSVSAIVYLRPYRRIAANVSL
jgi:hypothetical protein